MAGERQVTLPMGWQKMTPLLTSPRTRRGQHTTQQRLVARREPLEVLHSESMTYTRIETSGRGDACGRARAPVECREPRR